MQFRKQGKRIQVLGYRGYDKEKRRAKVEFLGSLSYLDYSLSDGLIERLTHDEKIELQSWCEKDRLSRQLSGNRALIKFGYGHIENMADSLSADEVASFMTDEAAQHTYMAMDKLAKALRKRGFFRRSGEASQQQHVVNDAPLLDAIHAHASKDSPTRAALILAELDAVAASDVEYRAAFSTWSKDALKSGETWRGRLVAMVANEVR